MKLSFELTMPNVGSWDGKWTGADKKYYRVHECTEKGAAAVLKGEFSPSFYHNFGDGWTACVTVEPVTDEEAAKRKEISAGFSSYDWMINEIVVNGEIKSADRHPTEWDMKNVLDPKLPVEYLKIQNDGVLDVRLVALMGGTTKAGNRFKIGSFGTGLKYTLAWLFRNNLSFHIFCGEEETKIYTESEIIGDAAFDIICINGNRTSITSQMGIQWNAWMIARELYSNSLDEGGALMDRIQKESQLKGEARKTTFFIQINSDIQVVLENWDNYFVHEKEPFWQNEHFAIHINRPGENLKLYKNGILIYQHPSQQSLFSYDVKNAYINELREFIGVVSSEIMGALEKPSQEVINYFLANISKEDFEGTQLHFDWFNTFTSVWKDTIGDRKIARVGDREHYSSNGIEVNFTNVIELPEKVYDALVKEFEGIGVLAQSDNKVDFFECEYPEVKDLIGHAVTELEIAGYHVDASFKIGMFKDGSIKMETSRRIKSIMVSPACLKISLKEFCCLLIEKNEFLKVKFDLVSLSFVRHITNLYASVFLHLPDEADAQRSKKENLDF